MSVAWWILKENPDSFHKHSTFLSWAACGKVYNSSRNDTSAWNKVAFCMCVSEKVCKDQDVSQSSAFFCLFVCLFEYKTGAIMSFDPLPYFPIWKCTLMELAVCVLFIFRDLIPGLAVRRQSGDHSLQSSGSRLQETASIHFPRGQRHCLCQVYIHLSCCHFKVWKKKKYQIDQNWQ